MHIRISVTVLFLVLLLSSSALAGDYYSRCYVPRDTFGDAFRTARDNQILNPDAAGNLDPVEGLDGQAARLNYDQYLGSFKKSSGGGGGAGGAVGFVPLIGGTAK